MPCRQANFGLSSGLIYVPANYTGTDEIIELAKVAGQFKGIYTTHMRSEGDQQMAAIDETLRIAYEAGIAAHISHHKIIGRNNWVIVNGEVAVEHGQVTGATSGQVLRWG